MSRFRHHSYFAHEKLRWLYLWPYACFDCRIAFKRPFGDATRPCPRCRGDATILSRGFRPPKQSAVEEWETARFLCASGFVYQHVLDERGENVPYPRTMAAAREFAAKYAAQRKGPPPPSPR